MDTTKVKAVIRISIAILIGGLFAFGMIYLPSPPVIADAGPQPTPAAKRIKFSEFPHDARAHRLDCGKCHKFPSANWKKVRAADKAFPDITDYPKHDSCVKCHMPQFFRSSRPAICSICHTNPSPRDSSRHPFPNPRETFDLSKKGKTAESDFAVAFPHDKHIEIVSRETGGTEKFVNAAFVREDRRRAAEESCSICHQTMLPQGKSDDEYVTKPPPKLGDAFWLKKGTFKSAPIGHTACFTCHSADTGMLPAPQTCAACHQLKPAQPAADFDETIAAGIGISDKVMMDTWRRRLSAGAFRHEFFAHVELSCSTCHNVLTIKTADPVTTKVSISSCAACHATPTSDDGGALNYEIDSRNTTPAFQCVKCHLTFGRLPVPGSHTQAVAAAAVK